jgi:hypothetical protein
MFPAAQFSCGIVRVTSIHYIKSIRMFEDDVIGGLGSWCGVCNLKNVCLLLAVTIFLTGFFFPSSCLAR